MTAHPRLRPAAAFLALALLAAGCGGGGSSQEPASQALPPPILRLDAPPVSTDLATGPLPAIEQVDQAVQSALQQYRLPGATIAVLQDDKIIYAKGYGYANLSARTPVKPEDRFQIGSISKQFVATAILLLMEEGKLALDDSVTKYIPGLPDNWRGVTIRHLLDHTSGLPMDPPQEFASRFADVLTGSDADRIAAVAAIPLKTAPGAKFEYSNVGYGLLGMLAGKLAGMDYYEFLQQRVFRPLGMSSVRKVDSADAMMGAAALGYRQEGNGVLEAHSPNLFRYAALGAGGLAMNVLDMAKWDAALYGNQVLKPASMAEMSRPQVALGRTSSYGLGWFLDTLDGHFVMRHSGGMDGYTTEYRRFRDDHFSVIVFTNLRYPGDGPSGAESVAQILTTRFMPAPQRH